MFKNFTALFWISTLFLPAFAQAQNPLFTSQACHPRLTPSCVLYPYANEDLDQGEVPYSVMLRYYEQTTSGLITANPDPVTLQNSKYEDRSDQNKNHLTFRFDTVKMTFSPVQDLSPESVQKLFQFNISMFKQVMGVSSFNEAKKKYYQLTKFNRWKLNFERKILLPTDWRSLIHPPYFSLAALDEKPVTEQSNRSPASTSASSFWGKDYHLTLDSETRTELTQGNRLRLMVNNVSYSEKIKLVQEAKKYVFVAVMSFAYTSESQRLIDALIAQAQAGLDVRVIMEKVWGKIAFNKTIKKLRSGGVKVALANDLIRLRRNQGLFHSKYFVIDGERGVVGGQNLVDRSHKSTGYNHFNKDTDVRVEGPILTDMLEDYGKLWERFTKKPFPMEYKKAVLSKKEEERAQKVRGSENYPSWLSNESPGLCRFVSQGPNEDKYKISKAYFETFSRAEHDILLTTQIVNFQKHPLFKLKWSTKLYRKLFEKAESGIPVTLITNGIDGGFLKTYAKSDSTLEMFFKQKMNNITGYLNTALRRKKLEILGHVPNFDVWQHFQYIHSKVAVVDQTVSAIGSYNFETFSAENSYETAVFCQDQKLTQDLAEDLALTIVNSTPLTVGN